MLAKLKSLMHRQEFRAADARAAVELAKIDMPFLPWPGSAISPAALLHILNEIEINQRKTIVEFGSGISSLYIGKALKKLGGQLISFDSDKGWADLVSSWLKRENLDDVVDINYIPLQHTSYCLSETCQWYDPDAVKAILQKQKIDLLFVDAPVAYHKDIALSRYPALPVVSEFLAENCAVFLDDIVREAEQQILEKWQNESGINFLSYPACGGIARGVRGPAFHAAP